MTTFLAFALSTYIAIVGGVSQLQLHFASPGVELSWTASVTTGVTYNVFRGTVSGKENYTTPLNATPITVLEYKDNTVARNVKYFYTVEAVKASAHSVPSNEVSVKVF